MRKIYWNFHMRVNIFCRSFLSFGLFLFLQLNYLFHLHLMSFRKIDRHQFIPRNPTCKWTCYKPVSFYFKQKNYNKRCRHNRSTVLNHLVHTTLNISQATMNLFPKVYFQDIAELSLLWLHLSHTHELNILLLVLR